MLKQVDEELRRLDRTPAWLCRQAGVHQCNYTLIKKGEWKLSENLKNKFSDILGIRKEILFNNQKESKKWMKYIVIWEWLKRGTGIN